MAKQKKLKLVKISELTPEQLASICDHTFLSRPEVVRQEGLDSNAKYRADFEKFMLDMINGSLLPYAICIRPEDVPHAKKLLEEHGKTSVLIASVVGYPDGSWYDTDFKLAEAELAIKYGAKEVDMVLNYDRFKKGDLAYVKKDIALVTGAAHKNNALIKLILETSLLSNDEIINACKLADELRVDFVKTSTGYVIGGAKPEHLRLMRANFNRGVKMSGYVKTNNVKELLLAVSGRNDGYIELDPLKVRIGESGLLKGFS